MRLDEWVSESRDENENLDVFLQIVRLLLDERKGQGIISPVLYEVNDENDVTFIYGSSEIAETSLTCGICQEFHPPQTKKETKRAPSSEDIEKGDVFSLGLLLYYLFEQEVCPVNRSASSFQTPFLKSLKSRKRKSQLSAVIAQDSKSHSVLMQRMTAYDPASRPALKDVLAALSSKICKFAIVRENIHTGEHYREIIRCFSDSPSYKFVPEKEYTIDLVTVTPVSVEPMTIPFRLVKKQYILKVAYGGQGRWHCAERKVEAPSVLSALSASESAAAGVERATAALYFCDAVYGIEGDALFCETDGFTYKMGFYEYIRKDNDKKINIVKEGSIVVPERLEARIHSILREGSKAVYDLFCVAVYGNPTPPAIKTINDMFPEAVRIYRLDDDDILKGAALYLERTTSLTANN